MVFSCYPATANGGSLPRSKSTLPQKTSPARDGLFSWRRLHPLPITHSSAPNPSRKRLKLPSRDRAAPRFPPSVTSQQKALSRSTPSARHYRRQLQPLPRLHSGDATRSSWNNWTCSVLGAGGGREAEQSLGKSMPREWSETVLFRFATD